MGGITIRIGLPPSVDQFRAALALAVRAAAVEAIKIIKIRTARGRDIHGRVFPRYSERYGRDKKASGRRVNPPDLTLTGQMLGALKELRAEPRRAVIGWEGQRRAVRFRREPGPVAPPADQVKPPGRKVPKKKRKVQKKERKAPTPGVVPEGPAKPPGVAPTGQAKPPRRNAPKKQRTVLKTVLETLPGKMISYHDQVTGLERKFKFFAIEEPHEVKRLHTVAKRVIDEVREIRAARGPARQIPARR